MVQFGEAQVFPQFQIGAVAHPGVVAGLPVKNQTVFLVGCCKHGHIHVLSPASPWIFVATVSLASAALTRTPLNHAPL